MENAGNAASVASYTHLLIYGNIFLSLLSFFLNCMSMQEVEIGGVSQETLTRRFPRLHFCGCSGGVSQETLTRRFPRPHPKLGSPPTTWPYLALLQPPGQVMLCFACRIQGRQTHGFSKLDAQAFWNRPMFFVPAKHEKRSCNSPRTSSNLPISYQK